MKNFRIFLSDESGAVTVDWVTLVAGLMMLGIATVYQIFNFGVANVMQTIQTTLHPGISNSINTGTVENIYDATGSAG